MLWPIAVLFTPLAGTIAETNSTSLSKEAAFVGLLVALAFDELSAGQHTWLTARLSVTSQLTTSFARRFILGLGVTWMSMAPATVLGVGLDLRAYLVMAFTAAHLAALYSLAKALGLAPSSRSVLVSFIAIAVPATNLGEGNMTLIIQTLLDPRASHHAAGDIFMFITAQILSIVVLVFVSGALSLSRIPLRADR